MFALAAAAAAAAKEATPPRVSMPDRYVAQAPVQALPPWTLDSFWRLFNDPILNALEDEAFRASPDIRTAEARLSEARANRAGGIAATWPQGEATGNASHQVAYALGVAGSDLTQTTGVTNIAQGNFNVSWELDLFGRLATQRRIARATGVEAAYSVEGIKAELAANVADTYFQMRGFANQLDDALATVRIERDLLNIARRKAAAGAGPQDEVDRVAAEAERSEALAADIQAQLDGARRDLLIVVGRDLRDIENLPLTGDPPTVPPTPAVMPAELLTRRPDVEEAEYRLRAQLGNATLAHRALFPTITLLPGLGLNRTSEPGVSFIPPATLVNQQQTFSNGFWSLAVGVSIPVLDIPKLLDQAHAQDAVSREDAIAYEKAVRTAFGEAQNALTDLQAGEQATALLVDSELHARKAYDASRKRYAEGMDDLTATLTAEQSWRRIRFALTTERVLTLRSAVRTYKALGGGWNYQGGGIH
ncbi:MAG: TolC family protein [Caulobacteraceae bacterium]|nr:TolC family protein [Caulobacteraceae bacterium]